MGVDGRRLKPRGIGVWAFWEWVTYVLWFVGRGIQGPGRCLRPHFARRVRPSLPSAALAPVPLRPGSAYRADPLCPLALRDAASPQALRSGLKAMHALGVNGVVVEVFWGVVEGAGPRQYDWSTYRALIDLLRDEGFMVQVSLCFNSNDAVPLPPWVLEVGKEVRSATRTTRLVRYAQGTALWGHPQHPQPALYSVLAAARIRSA